MKRIALFLTLCLLAGRGIGQDIHFSQFFEAPLLRNPSLAGIFTGDIRVQTVYRDQWNSVTTAYKTVSINAEYKIPVGGGDDFLTTGLQILHDRAGTISWVSNHVMPAFNFHKSLNSERNAYLSLGFMGGLVQRSIDPSKMTTNSTFEGTGLGESFPSPTVRHLDGAVGMSFNTQLTEREDDNVFVGLAYHHFHKPKNSFYKSSTVELEPKWVASAGVKFSVTPASYITLQGDYSQQARYKETVFGALYGLKIGGYEDKPDYVLHGGAFMRLNDAFIPVVKLDYRPFSVSFSYDVNISKLRTSSYGMGGFELGISYVGFTQRQNSTLNAMRCPRF